MGLLIVVVFFLLAWGLFILPQQRRVRAQQALNNSLVVGDDVMTTAGLFGRITAIDGEEVRLLVAPGIELRFARAAIARRIDGTDVAPAAGDGTGSATTTDDSTGRTAATSDAPPAAAPLVQPRRGLQRRRPADPPASSDPDPDAAN
jgi:preprotein translocase subunit YajC